jgi:hypothetical protein
VTELEQRLVALAPAIEFPRTPSLAVAVERRLRRRRVGFLAAAVAGAALVLALVVPPARTALLHLFRVGSEEIHLVERLPEARPLAALDLGERLPLAEAERLAGVRAVLPQDEPDPDAVYARPGELTLLYGTPERVRLLVTELPAGRLPTVKKVVAPTTHFEVLSVGGHTGFWISGPPHVYEGRLAGNVLVYERGPLTIRLEGRLTKREALRLAAALAPGPR